MRKLPRVRVENMSSNASGRAVANQFIIYTEKGTYFQSYDSVIVLQQDGKTYLDRGTWDYSVTTSKYRNQFLDETTGEARQKIKSGEYILADLN